MRTNKTAPIHLSPEGDSPLGAACIEAGGSASAEEFDLDGIADTISIYSRRRGVFCLIVDTDDFWAVVEAHYTKGVNA